MAQSSVNTGAKKSSAGVAKPVAGAAATVKAPVKAAPAKAVAKPAPKPAPKVASVMVSIKAKDGSVKRVAMAKPKAVALAKKRAAARGASAANSSIADTTSMIPGAYRTYVDPKSIDAAVAATIKSQNDPILALKQNAQSQAQSNQQMGSSLAAQTQATMDTLFANANDRTQSYEQLSGQAIANQQQTNQAAAAAIQHALGSGYNDQVAAMTSAGLAPTYATQSAGGVQQTLARSLASQAQSDYFQRGKALAALSGQAFNSQQQRQLGQVLTNLDAQIAANQSKKAQLVADTAAQQANFGLQAQTASQAFGQQGIVNKQKDRALNIDAAKVKASGSNAKAAAQAKLSTAQAKVLKDVKAAVDKKNTQALSGTKSVTIPTMVDDPNRAGHKIQLVDKNGNPRFHTETQRVTTSQAFGPNNGPWRDAWTQLTDQWGALGMTPQQAADMAALQATKWYPQSLKTSTPEKIVTMLRNRGVSTPVIKQLVAMVPVPKVVKPSDGVTGAGTTGLFAPFTPAGQASASAANKAVSYIRNLSPKKVKKGVVVRVGGKPYKITSVKSVTTMPPASLSGVPAGSVKTTTTVKLKGPDGVVHEFEV